MSEEQQCELCQSSDSLILHARCHITAPLQVTMEGTTLILRCYVPSCRREIARFTVTSGPNDPPEEPTTEAYQRVLLNDPLVNAMHHKGCTQEEIIVAMYERHQAQTDKLCEMFAASTRGGAVIDSKWNDAPVIASSFDPLGSQSDPKRDDLERDRVLDRREG